MAAGWNARLVVETWSQGEILATNIGLAIASRHTDGRHVCIVPDELSRSEYKEVTGEAGMSPEIIVGEAGEAMEGVLGIDFLMVNSPQRDFARVLRLGKLSSRGAVLMRKNASSRDGSSFKWGSVVDDGSGRLVRSVFLPVGKGLDIAHVATSRRSCSNSGKGESRWIKHVDRQSGEECVIRK